MSQYFLSLPHDSEEEPTMADAWTRPSSSASWRTVGAFNAALVEAGRRSSRPAG